MKRYILLIVVGLLVFSVSFAKSKKTKPANPYTLLVQKGDSCRDAFDLFHAADFYRQAQRLNNSLEIRRKSAELCYKTGNYAQCIAIIRTITPDSLSHADQRLLYFSYSRHSQPDSMIVEGERIVREYPYDSEITADLSGFYNKGGGAARARMLLTSYYAKDSSNIVINKQLGYACYQTKDYAQALHLFDKIRAAGDHSYNICYLTGMTYYLTDSLTLAYKYLKEAATLKEFKNAESLCRLGIVCIDLGSIKGQDSKYIYDGLKYIKTAIELTQPQPQLMFSLYNKIAEGNMKLSEYNQTLDALQQCLVYNPDHAATYYKMAQVYSVLHNPKKERDYYRQFLDLAEKSNDSKEQFKPLIEKASKRLREISE